MSLSTGVVTEVINSLEQGKHWRSPPQTDPKLGRICPRFVSSPHQEPTELGRLILRDGTTAQVRMARPEDSEALHIFFQRLSPESRRRRFFSAFLPRPKLVASLCDNKDPHSALTLLVIGAHAGEPRMIATGSYLAEDEQSAEVAFAVDDAYQGQGLGTFLLERLALLAVRNGFTRFRAVTQADNQFMRDVFRESGFALDERLEGGEVKVNLSIVPRQTRMASGSHLAGVVGPAGPGGGKFSSRSASGTYLPECDNNA